MASSHTCLAARLAAAFAIAVSSAGGVPCGPASRSARWAGEARAFELDRHVGDLPLQPWKSARRAVADLAVVHVADRVLERALRGPRTSRRCRSVRG